MAKKQNLLNEAMGGPARLSMDVAKGLTSLGKWSKKAGPIKKWSKRR